MTEFMNSPLLKLWQIIHLICIYIIQYLFTKQTKRLRNYDYFVMLYLCDSIERNYEIIYENINIPWHKFCTCPLPLCCHLPIHYPKLASWLPEEWYKQWVCSHSRYLARTLQVAAITRVAPQQSSCMSHLRSCNQDCHNSTHWVNTLTYNPVAMPVQVDHVGSLQLPEDHGTVAGHTVNLFVIYTL